jgi:hypothetical protein
MKTALHRAPAPRADCPCEACQRLGSAVAFHAAAIVIGYPALIVATRSIVRLISTEVDRKHRLSTGGVIAYRDDAEDGILLDIPDPIRAGQELAGGPFA